jgi:hypothetical protein
MLTYTYWVEFVWAALLVAICGYTITVLLMEERGLLGWYMRWISGFPVWLYKPLGGCTLCFTGQLALWGFLMLDFGQSGIFPLLWGYPVLNHVIFVLMAIFFTHLILQSEQYLTNKLWK